MDNFVKWLGEKVLQFLFVVIVVIGLMALFGWKLSTVNLGPFGFAEPQPTAVIVVVMATPVPNEQPIATNIPAQQPVVVNIVPTNALAPVPPQQVSVPSVESNLLRNNSFENGISDWFFSERHITGLYETSGYNGKGFCSRQNLTESDAKGWVGFYQDVKVEPKQKYLFTGWVLLEKAIQFHVKTQWYNGPSDAGWSIIIPASALAVPPNGDTTNGWVFVHGEVIAPENANLARIVFAHGVINDEKNVANGAFCADELVFGKLR